MIDTLFSTRRFVRRLLRRRSRAPLGRQQLSSQAGDTLIEVVVGALLVGLIVVGTFSGLDSTNKATSRSRARSQADALAEHAEEQLRSEPIKKLTELTESHPLTETVTENGSTYTIVSTAQYVSDTTGTSSCTSSSEKADYLQTTSKVTSPLIGAGRSVEETGIISPPAGSALIVQVQESGTALQGAKVVATGPSPAATSYELETSAKGCAILAVPPGEYNIYVSKTSYVDPNGYENTHEDPSTTRSVYIPAETTSKVGYNLGLAGKLAVSLTGSTPAEGDTFVAYNTGMSSFRTFGTLGKYGLTVESPNSIFPFPTKYTVYAGTCEADLPTKNGQVSNPEILVAPGKTGSVAVPLAPITMQVRDGTSSVSPGSVMTSGVTGTIEDTGCKASRAFTANASGALPKPGMPFGTYSLCVTATIGGKPRKFTSFTPILNNKATGVIVSTIYLGAGKEELGCP
jgi:Tfp pilus assembly protein PilV